MTAALAKSRHPADRLTAALPAGVVRFEVTDRASWLSMRGQDVTASVIAALIGEHPYMTRLGLYALKTGNAPDSEVEAKVTENSISLPPMLRGTVLEPVVPTMIRMLRPSWKVEPCGWYYREPETRIGGTPDFVAIDPARPGVGIVQVKTTDIGTFRKIWRQEDGEVLPPMFIVIQAIVEAVLTGASWAVVAVLVTGSNLDLHLIPIPLHLGIMARLRAEVAKFWKMVAAGEMPPADYGRDGEVLAALYRTDNGQEIDLTADNHLPELLAQRDEHKSAIRNANEQVERIDTELKERLGPHESALIAGDRRITWRIEHRRHRFVPQDDTRVFRVSPPKIGVTHVAC